MGPAELKTVRANGESVSDFVRSAQDESVWELRFKRRIIGPVQFQIEYERRGERVGDSESLSPVDFPDARQLGYYYAVRTGGRLEIETGTMTQGWQTSDWSTVPQPLRDAGNRNAPALALRAMSPTTPLSLRVRDPSFVGRCLETACVIRNVDDDPISDGRSTDSRRREHGSDSTQQFERSTACRRRTIQ